MHYHMEIIMPPTDDVETAVKQIMAPFDEQPEPDEDGEICTKYTFYDYYVIGGRWSGHKLERRYSKERRDAFFQAIVAAEITVSSFQFGKQEIAPAYLIPKVDALWREHFPDGGEVCPLFAHYKGAGMDVCKLKDMPEGLTASHVIVAIPEYGNEDKMEAQTMYQDSIYNGVSWLKTTWDSKVQSVIDAHIDYYKNATDQEYLAKRIPNENWLVVTIDYHS